MHNTIYIVQIKFIKRLYFIHRWKAVYGKYPDQTDVDNMFKDFVPMQLECLPKYTTLIPGCAEAISTLKNELKMKIGSSTGFTKSMVDVLLREAKKQGYSPDSSVAGDEVINGARPKPFMVYRNLDMLNVSPIQSVVKVCGVTLFIFFVKSKSNTQK